MNARKTKDSEFEIQKKIHRYLSDPSRVLSTTSGKRLQVLSPGVHNVHEGPDFREIAILLNGFVYVGDSEFHRKSSEWDLHKHEADNKYESVILHIVFEEDIKLNRNFETLLIKKNSIEMTNLDDESEVSLDSIDELQHFALVRLLRRTAEAGKIIRSNSMEEALLQMSIEFINKYNSRRRRPVYDKTALINMLDKLKSSQIYDLLSDIKLGIAEQVPDRLISILKKRIHEEGPHLRRELIINSILPIALYIANESVRIDLFLWYWSTPALNKYGLLTRKYKHIPQNFLWQQQGMLEFIREHGRKQNIVSEALRTYGFAEVLNFYKAGLSPYERKYEDR